LDAAYEVEKATGQFSISANGATYLLVLTREYPLRTLPEHIDRLTAEDLRRLRNLLNEFFR
jgi:hypothetical protein